MPPTRPLLTPLSALSSQPRRLLIIPILHSSPPPPTAHPPPPSHHLQHQTIHIHASQKAPRLHPRLQPSAPHNHHHTTPPRSTQQHSRHHSTTPSPAETAEPTSPTPKIYTYPEIQALATHPEKGRIIIDLREPHELSLTGRIPTSYSMPLVSNPDAFHLPPTDFFARFGFVKPTPLTRSEGGSVDSVGGDEGGDEEAAAGSVGATEVEAGEGGEMQDLHRATAKEEGEGEGVEEVIFYCKAGVRSRAAARLAREWRGVRVGDMRGGWVEWERSGGEAER